MRMRKCFLDPFCLMSEEKFPIDETGLLVDRGEVMLAQVAMCVLSRMLMAAGKQCESETVSVFSVG